MLASLNVVRLATVIRSGIKDPGASAALQAVIEELQSNLNPAIKRLNELDGLVKLSTGDLYADSVAIRNLRSRFEFDDPPEIQNVAGATQQLIVRGRTNRLKNTSGGNLTLTHLPTIAAGKNEELAIFQNIGAAGNIVLQDRGTLANSGLFLAAATRTLAPRQNITLRFQTDLGGVWAEHGYSPVL